MDKYKFIYVLVFLLTFANSFCQKSTTNVDKLLSINKTKEISVALVETFFDAYKEKYPKIDNRSWTSIKSKIKLEKYYESIKNIYLNAYTDAEIKELIKLYAPKTIDKYKERMKRVELDLYNLGVEFGKSINMEIKNSIRNLGY